MKSRRTDNLGKSAYKKRCCLWILLFAMATGVYATPLGFVQQFDDPGNDDTDHYFYFPTGIAISNDGAHVYLSSTIEDSITMFSADQTTGELTKIGEVRQDVDGIDGLGSAKNVIVSPDGKHVYGIGLGHGTGESTLMGSIVGFSRDTATGELSPIDVRQEGVNVDAGIDVTNAKMAFSPDGNFLYISGFNSDNLLVFQRFANGVLEFVESYDGYINGNEDIDNIALAWWVTVSPDGKNVYVTADGKVLENGAVTVFSRNEENGTLTFVEALVDGQNGITGLNHPEQIVVSPDNKHVYVASWSDHAIAVFERAGDGKLTQVETVTYNADNKDLFFGLKTLTFSPNGRILYAGGDIASTVSLLHRDETTGKLTPVGYETDNLNNLTLGDVVAATVSPNGRFLYVATDQKVDGITVFDTAANLSVVKQDTDDPVDLSAGIEYTITVTNNGPSDATFLTVSDVLPSGVSFVEATSSLPQGNCSEAGGTVTCDLEKLPLGAQTLFTINVTAPDADSNLENTVSVSADQVDQDEADNEDSEQTVVGAGQSSNKSNNNDSGGGLFQPLLFLPLLILSLLRRRSFYHR